MQLQMFGNQTEINCIIDFRRHIIWDNYDLYEIPQLEEKFSRNLLRIRSKTN